MTVYSERWITMIAWLAFITVGTPAGATTDGLQQSRYLESITGSRIAQSSISISRSDRKNPLRPAHVQVVISGMDGQSPDQVVASCNAASLKLMMTPESRGNDKTVAEGSPSMIRLQAQTTRSPMAEGRILVQPSLTENPVPAVNRTIASSLQAVSRLVRSAYEPIPPAMARLRQAPAMPVANSRPVPVLATGYRSKTAKPSAHGKSPLPLRRPRISNIDVFTVSSHEAADLGQMERSGWNSPIMESEVSDDSCWFLNDWGCTNCTLGSPTPARSTLARIRDQRLLEDFSTAPMDDALGSRQLSIGKSGLPAVSISHSRIVPAKSITIKSLYASIKSIATTVGRVVQPLLDIAHRWQLRQQIDSVYQTFKSMAWPGYLGAA